MEKLDIISQFTDLEDQNLAEKCVPISESINIYISLCAFLKFYVIVDIKSGKYDILAFIESLGELLVNQSPSRRELGTTILTEVLSRLDHGLKDQELPFIVQFYISKLNEHHQVRINNEINNNVKLMSQMLTLVLSIKAQIIVFF